MRSMTNWQYNNLGIANKTIFTNIIGSSNYNWEDIIEIVVKQWKEVHDILLIIIIRGSNTILSSRIACPLAE